MGASGSQPINQILKFYVRTKAAWLCNIQTLSKTKQSQPNLYLVGFMGVGKSAIGRRVARELGFRFIDSDDQIEKAQKKKIPAIFADEGEPHFRKLEREFIESGHPCSNCVISCGGGLVIQEGMKDLLKEKGVVICLFASAESIIERTSLNKNRPLLNVDNPEEKVRKMLEEREPIYMDSGACITTEGRTIPEVVKHMVRTYETNARSFKK